jgi:hypothetical protein
MTPVVSVQNRYNVSDRQEAMLDLCEQEDLAFCPTRRSRTTRGTRRSATGPYTTATATQVVLRLYAVAGDAADPGTGSVPHCRGERTGADISTSRPTRLRLQHRGVNPGAQAPVK